MDAARATWNGGAMADADPDDRFPLARFAGARPTAPDWYRALPEPETVHAHVEGARLEVLVWGEAGRPGLLLVHGSRAHAHWWAPVAGLLADRYRIASLSLSGMGGSDWRETYSTDLQVAEMLAAIEAAGLREAAAPPVVAGHSYGGRVAAFTGAAHGDALGGVILVDSMIGPEKPIGGRTLNPAQQFYPDLVSLLARFRLSPDQPADYPHILDDMARAGAKRLEDGRWTWRFDPTLHHRTDPGNPWGALGAVRCPLAVVHGARSAVVARGIVEQQRAHLRPGTPFVAIPHAFHHVMFDQPVALAAVLDTLAQRWIGPVAT